MVKSKKKLTKRDIEVYCSKILADAIDNILSDKQAKWYKRAKVDDLLWMLSDNNENPFSFLNVCEFLNINNYNKIRKIIIILSTSKDPKYVKYSKRETLFEIIKSGFVFILELVDSINLYKEAYVL